MFLKKSPNVLKMNIFMFQTKIMVYVATTRLTMMHNILIPQEKTTTVTCQLLLKTQNKLQEVRKNCRETCIRQSKKYLHQAKIIFVFKKLEKVIVLNSVWNNVCWTKLLIKFLRFISLKINRLSLKGFCNMNGWNNTFSQLVFINNRVTVFCMNTDVLKISKIYTNHLENVMINRITKQF